MELKGTIIEVFPVQQISDKFSKQSFVLKVDDEQYTQEILLEVPQAKLDLTQVKGKKATVYINIKGRRYEKNNDIKWFNSIEAWKIVTAVAPQDAPQPELPEDEGENDLPF